MFLDIKTDGGALPRPSAALPPRRCHAFLDAGLEGSRPGTFSHVVNPHGLALGRQSQIRFWRNTWM